MRTTVDLPDDLYRRLKASAALEGRTVKETITAYVAKGLESGGAWTPMTNAEVNDLMDQEDAEKHDRLLSA